MITVIVMGNTDENLGAAFSGESQANRRYLFFADKAEEEGHPQIARLFRGAAESETVHARCHFQALGNVKDTEENLKVAIEGENYEHTEMYPGFIDDAKAEGEKEARLCFSYARAVEKKHEKMFKDLLGSLKSGKSLEEEEVFVCSVCGNLETGEAPDTCPICGNPKEVFSEVE